MKNYFLLFILSHFIISDIKSQVHSNIYYVPKYEIKDSTKAYEVIPKSHPIFIFKIASGKIEKIETPIKTFILETFNKKINLYDFEATAYLKAQPTKILNVTSDETHPLKIAYVSTDFFSEESKIETWEISYKLNLDGSLKYIQFEKGIWADDERYWLGVEETYQSIQKNYTLTLDRNKK